ncbi:MAG TPA: alginate lyase family protein [Candidatus Solibacter sp.]|nr:alginate lyase family protein [Candidatus Solibacter sp.]
MDRVRQRAMARLDALRCSSGVGFEPRLSDSTAAQPNFFFAPDNVADLCRELRTRFPQQAREIISRAERICLHRFDLLGYKELDYGKEIDWHADRVHNKRAPRKPWFEIRYLDFDDVGDSKVTWELSRHQHLVTLAKAYRLSGEEKFAAELLYQWNHWHQENPYPIGINWASSLEVAFRSLSWLWMYALMSGSSALPVGFRAEMNRHLGVSARHIETYLSTYFSPNTHLLGEGVALFFVSTLCPELPGAGRWQRKGWSIVVNEARRQVRTDGLHFERSTYYHVYALDFFLHTALLALRNRIAVPAEFEKTIERMLEVLCVLGRTGPIPRLGDDDGGRLFDPKRNRVEHLTDPLATGAVLFGRGDFKSACGGLTEESLWLLGSEGAAEFDKLQVKRDAAVSTAYQPSGLYILANKVHEAQLVIDSGPQGTDSGGHGHADALSITVSACGKPLLIDSGTYEYVGNERDRFRGTKSHNTLVVDGVDQAEPVGPFRWERLPRVQAEGWITGENFDLFVGSHDGYRRLAEPVVHRRFVFSNRSNFWLVRDLAIGKGQHQLDLYWHVAPAESPLEKSGTTFRCKDVGLSILVEENHGWSEEVTQENCSPVYGCKERHNVLHFRTNATLPGEFVSLLIPGAVGETEARTVKRISTGAAGEPSVYRYKSNAEEHLMIFGDGKAWQYLEWRADAEVLYWRETEDESRCTLIVCNGRRVEFGAKEIVSSPNRFLRCEIVQAAEQVSIVASDGQVRVDEKEFSKVAAALRGRIGRLPEVSG